LSNNCATLDRPISNPSPVATSTTAAKINTFLASLFAAPAQFIDLAHELKQYIVKQTALFLSLKEMCATSKSSCQGDVHT
jgi:hypothetical protein